MTGMARKSTCEICAARAAIPLDLEERRVSLCRTHADQALSAEACSVDELRRLFLEPDGRRALLARRAKDERRMFPPRPEGRRLDEGRRQTDARD
jgi:hypothetical protein